MGAELRGVDEDGDGDHVALRSGRAHQREMPGVERAHSGNQAQALACLASGTAGGAHFLDGAKDLHSIVTPSEARLGGRSRGAIQLFFVSPRSHERFTAEIAETADHNLATDQHG
jgi:hypothetical protein